MVEKAAANIEGWRLVTEAAFRGVKKTFKIERPEIPNGLANHISKRFDLPYGDSLSVNLFTEVAPGSGVQENMWVKLDRASGEYVRYKFGQHGLMEIIYQIEADFTRMVDIDKVPIHRVRKLISGRISPEDSSDPDAFRLSVIPLTKKFRRLVDQAAVQAFFKQ